MPTGNIFEIKRFAVHDGPGIRTTIFLKGCPLRCRWCHNPEGIKAEPQLAYYEHKCIHCGECVSVCPHGAHALAGGRHIFDREKCLTCGACEGACPGRAIKLFGTALEVEEAVDIVLEDRDFYTDGGGVTLSGGEPLLQAEFCKELLGQLKKHGIDCAIDTSGAVPWSAFETVLAYTDRFLYDVKHSDPKKHQEHTGISNSLILKNLKRLSEYGVPVEVRVPVIHGFNADSESIDGIIEELRSLPNITGIKLLPFHDCARSKYSAIGEADTVPKVETPSQELMESFTNKIMTSGITHLHGV